MIATSLRDIIMPQRDGEDMTPGGIVHASHLAMRETDCNDKLEVTMVVVVASAEIAEGKTQEARDLSKRYASRMRALGVDLEVLVPSTPGPGQANRILWSSRHESIEQWAAFFEKKEMHDAERQALIREGWEQKLYFVPNTFVRTVYRIL